MTAMLETSVAAERDALDDLRRRAAETAAAAVALEAQLASEGVEPAIARWTYERFLAWLTAVRAQEETDASVVVAMAFRDARRIRETAAGAPATATRARAVPFPRVVMPRPLVLRTPPPAAIPSPPVVAAPVVTRDEEPLVGADDGFWRDEPTPRWRRARPTRATVLEAAAGLAAALALLVHFW
jgi:hypothetical protein